MIETPRLKLIPATVVLSRAEIGDRAEFARIIEADVPEDWPPASVADALPLFLQWIEAAPEQVGWFGWYALAKDNSGNRPVLVASGGFLGPPQNGEVCIGYSVLPQFQQRGFATELADGLIKWAQRRPDVFCIVAETEWANPASVRVLSKLGFVAAGPGSDPAGMRFELSVKPVAKEELPE